MSSLTNLTAGTIYYVRAYATNKTGTGYGNAVSFATLPPVGAPALSTTSPSAITQTSATCGGNITDQGSSSVSKSGICWSIAGPPTIADNITTDGNGSGSFTGAMSDLAAGTIYYVRAYATNSIGTSYGNLVSFTTVPGLIGNNDNGTLEDKPATTICVIRYQCNLNMTVSKMFVFIAESGIGTIKCAIYADENGNPGSLLTSTIELTNPGTGWISFDVTSKILLTSGSYYQLALWTDNSGYGIWCTKGGGTPYLRGLFYGPWPDPLGQTSPWFGGVYCIYAQ
jgi:hypothetical protein